MLNAVSSILGTLAHQDTDAMLLNAIHGSLARKSHSRTV